MQKTRRGEKGMEVVEDTLYLQLHKLSATKSEEALDQLLSTLWKTRKTGLRQKSHFQSLLNLQSLSELDPVCLFDSQLCLTMNEWMKECMYVMIIGFGMPSFAYQKMGTWKLHCWRPFQALSTRFTPPFAEHFGVVAPKVSVSMEGGNS